MKKLFYFALCVILIFSLTACNKEDKKELPLDDQIKQAYLDKTKEEAPHNEMSVRYVYNFEDAYAAFCGLFFVDGRGGHYKYPGWRLSLRIPYDSGNADLQGWRLLQVDGSL